MQSEPTPEQILSARPEELVMMLFQGAARFGHEAIAHLDDDRDDLAAESIHRVRAILAELDRTIDHDAGPLGRHMAAIYEYLVRRISAPVVDRAEVVEVISDIEEIGAAWAALVEQRNTELQSA